ncbi:MAG: hypothetical protein RSE61_00295 [Anaerovoracaceae bacterium]
MSITEVLNVVRNYMVELPEELTEEQLREQIEIVVINNKNL